MGDQAIRVLALDPSLTGLGWATSNCHDQPTTGTLTSKPPTTEHRLAQLAHDVLSLVDIYDADIVAMEGLAMGAKGRAITDLAGLHWTLRIALYGRQRAPIIISPATIKKYATGKGTADKQAVLAAAIRRLQYDGHDHNEADALWLLAAIYDAAGHPICDMPQSHRDALAPIIAALETHPGA